MEAAAVMVMRHSFPQKSRNGETRMTEPPSCVVVGGAVPSRPSEPLLLKNRTDFMQSDMRTGRSHKKAAQNLL
jgi:hypothetical protein